MNKLSINLNKLDSDDYEAQNCIVDNSLASGLSYQINMSKDIRVSTISEVLRIELSKYGINRDIKEYESFQQAVGFIYDYYDKKINHPNEYPKEYYDNLIFLIVSFVNFAINLYSDANSVYGRKAVSYNDILNIVNNFFAEV
ncbi:MAG: hypothetical protein ACI4V7_09455 [Succinivibrionaceae bacterium]